jgi:hypothetical protein
MSRAVAASKRRPTDSYYTPQNLAASCVRELVAEGVLAEGDQVLEPHAGGGSFVYQALEAGAFVHAQDINPEAWALRMKHPRLSSAAVDFQAPDVAYLLPRLVLGNPPFSTAEAEVSKALEVTDRFVAFILRLGILESVARIPFWHGGEETTGIAGQALRKIWTLASRPSYDRGQRPGELMLFEDLTRPLQYATSGTDSAVYGFFLFDLEHAGPAEIVPCWDWRPAESPPIYTLSPEGQPT